MYLLLKVSYRFDSCSMCVNGRFITNKYTGQTFWSECGKCKACRQKKAAARSSRIRNEYDGETNIFFVTLTYDRLSAPYILQDDIDRLKYECRKYGCVVSPLNVYRRFKIRWNPNQFKYNRDWSKPYLLNQVFCDFNEKEDFYRLRWLEKQPGKIGVCYFPDIQKFNKRLRERLKSIGYAEKIKIFDCTEYGSKSQRPHCHLLIFARDISQEAFHAAVIKSWPFGRRIRNSKSCQLVTDDPAGYVSSYVNCDSSISSFLAKYFPPKHSASKYFGYGRKSFRLAEIQKKVSEGDLSYDVKRVTNSGEKIFHLPIPKYVVNRFFPVFKGYSRFTDNTISEFLSRGFDVGYLFRRSLEFNLDHHPRYWLEYSFKDTDVPSDLRKISVRLHHAYDYYCKVFPGSSHMDYAKSFINAWKVYRSTVYKHFVTDPSTNDFYKYDNICLLPLDQQRDLHSRLGHGCAFITDNNCKPQRVNETIFMTEMFDRYDKQKQVSNICLNEKGVLV